LDSKERGMQEIIAGAPSLLDHLDEQSKAHLEGLKQLLDDAGIGYTVNPRLVRGLDYYTRTVFEWITTRLGSQDAVCSGGRYDGLVEHLGGKPTPGIGFAMGVERLVSLMEEEGVAVPQDGPQIYVVRVGEAAERAAFTLAERLRDELPGLRLQMDCSGGGFGNQLKRADKSGAGFALVLGDDEVAAKRVALKPLRGGEQEQLTWDALPDRLKGLVA
jgi:histidyl-tRNA synthetase